MTRATYHDYLDMLPEPLVAGIGPDRQELAFALLRRFAGSNWQSRRFHIFRVWLHAAPEHLYAAGGL